MSVVDDTSPPEASLDKDLSAPADVWTTFDDAFAPMFRVAYQVAYALIGERTAAEDVAQEVLTRAALRWRRLRTHPDVVGWAATVASRVALNSLRGRQRRERREAAATEPKQAARVDETVATSVDLREELRGLPDRQRDAVVLRFIADLGEAEVARLLGCSPGAVKQHTSRALTRLRRVDPASQEEPHEHQ